MFDLQKCISSNKINAQVINDKFEKTPDMEPDDYPDWNLGINLDNTKNLSQELNITIPFMNDVAVGRNFQIKDISFTTELKIYNLFNETYHSILYRPMPGRNFTLVFMMKI